MFPERDVIRMSSFYANEVSGCSLGARYCLFHLLRNQLARQSMIGKYNIVFAPVWRLDWRGRQSMMTSISNRRSAIRVLAIIFLRVCDWLGFSFSSVFAFSFREPPFLLFTWWTKRRALVAAITGCPSNTDIR